MNEPTVFIVDDDGPVADALQALLQTEGYRTETFGSALAFLERYVPGDPGCLIADVRMPDMSGLELQEVVVARGLGLPVVIMTGHGDVAMAIRAMKAGAIDFLEKPFPDTVILDAVRRALATDATTTDAARAAEATVHLRRLTPRERQVLELLVDGQPNRHIADTLALERRSVEIHRARIMEKMRADTLSQLVRLALAAQIIAG